jgi:hypothetical protein
MYTLRCLLILLLCNPAYAQSMVCSQDSTVRKLITTTLSGEPAINLVAGSLVQWGSHANANIWCSTGGICYVGPISGTVANGTLLAQTHQATFVVAANQLRADTNAIITDASSGGTGVLQFSDSDGYLFTTIAATATLWTCGSALNSTTVIQGTKVVFAGSLTGVVPVTPTRECMCTYQSDATPTYRWQNTQVGTSTAGQYGTATSCP